MFDYPLFKFRLPKQRMGSEKTYSHLWDWMCIYDRAMQQ